MFVFEAAARCGNFTKAAAELYVTQPAVSRMLARFEEHLGVQLFERIPGGIALTADGDLLYRRISEGFGGIETALQEIEARHSSTETVSLSVSTAFTTHWLMPRMHKLQKEFPSIDLRFQLIPGPIGGPVDDVDLGMRFVSSDELDHDAVLLLPEILVPVCTPAYRDGTSGSEGVQSTLINLSDSPTDWFSHFQSFREGGKDSPNSLEFSDYAVVLQAALLGQGVAVGWMTVVSHWMRVGAFVPAEQDVAVTGRVCHLIHSRKKPSRSAVTEIGDWIIKEMQADFAAVDRMHPSLGLASLARSG